LKALRESERFWKVTGVPFSESRPIFAPVLHDEGKTFSKHAIVEKHGAHLLLLHSWDTADTSLFFGTVGE
jgi:hypothetical protein